MDKYNGLALFIKEVQGSLLDLFNSGFASAHESTLKDLKEFSDLAQVYGLAYASISLSQLYEDFNGKRHQFQNEYTQTLDQFTKLSIYLKLCIQRIEILQLKEKMTNEEPE